MAAESCGICGGDGRISNSFGNQTRCPTCHGTGRRDESSSGIRDVTKTKAAHHRPTNRLAEAPPKPQWPVTFEGVKLATEVNESGHTPEVKARLVREIIEYEGARGTCTQTFQRKVRKQIRPAS